MIFISRLWNLVNKLKSILQVSFYILLRDILEKWELLHSSCGSNWIHLISNCTERLKLYCVVCGMKIVATIAAWLHGNAKYAYGLITVGKYA